ncbi:RCC1 repeat domain protein [Minicystis rosea]|nr:RCC1 repeat domain protein [Minicystis rosea]
METFAKRAFLPLSLIAFAVGAFVACGGNDPINPQPDGGTEVDSGVPDAEAPDASTPDAETPDTGVPDADVPDTSAPDADVPDTGVPDPCQSPFVVTLDPNAQAKATTALAALSPSATLTWSSVRGTLSSISDLVVELPGCTGNVDVFEQLFDYLDQSPDLFQIDRTEWHGNGPLACSEVLASGFHTVIIRRDKFGPYVLRNDVFSAVADVKNGTVILRNFSGTYIPKGTKELIGELQSCPDKTDAEATPVLLATPFGFQKFAPSPEPPCTFAGTGQYTTMTPDTLTFDPNIELMWEEDVNLTVHRQRSATLVVAPSNYTAALQNSDANCQGDTGPNIGWIRTFDSVTGKILYDHANPDPYCQVCLH